jgi:hypothetical protein
LNDARDHGLLLLAAEDGETASAATMDKTTAALKYRLASKSIARRYGEGASPVQGRCAGRPDRRRASRVAASCNEFDART